MNVVKNKSDNNFLKQQTIGKVSKCWASHGNTHEIGFTIGVRRQMKIYFGSRQSKFMKTYDVCTQI